MVKEGPSNTAEGLFFLVKVNDADAIFFLIGFLFYGPFMVYKFDRLSNGFFGAFITVIFRVWSVFRVVSLWFCVFIFFMFFCVQEFIDRIGARQENPGTTINERD